MISADFAHFSDKLFWFQRTTNRKWLLVLAPKAICHMTDDDVTWPRKGQTREHNWPISKKAGNAI